MTVWRTDETGRPICWTSDATANYKSDHQLNDRDEVLDYVNKADQRIIKLILKYIRSLEQ